MMILWNRYQGYSFTYRYSYKHDDTLEQVSGLQFYLHTNHIHDDTLEQKSVIQFYIQALEEQKKIIN
jgi:hypothetical protein